MQRERKRVPRFRRVNVNVDIDDQEDRRAIEEDLRSDFTWTSDAVSTTNSATTIDCEERREAVSSLFEERSVEEWKSDLGEERSWKIDCQSEEKIVKQWIEEETKGTTLSLAEEILRSVHWSIDDGENDSSLLRFAVPDQQHQKNQHDLLTEDQRPLLSDPMDNEDNHVSHISLSLSSKEISLFL